MTDLEHDLLAPGMELVQTHISRVFLGKDRVWKVKKPVNYGFLDFSTVERRKKACEAEVRLNARLAPGIYERVVPVTRDASGRHAFDGPGDIVDWAVQMARLPDARRADLLLEQGLLTPQDMDTLAHSIARFHARMPPLQTEDGAGGPRMLLTNVSENFAQTRETVGDHVSAEEALEIERKQLAFIAEHRDLLEERVRTGHVRDGHGDLRLEHVYLVSSEPVVIDCIEFNERFRFADTCADIAFLSMDLSRMGRTDLAERFLATYARASGDYDLYRLVDFYESYRAYVRAKVASLLCADPYVDVDARARAASDARRYYLFALAAGRPPLSPPALVIVGGIIASGKSTIADRIAALLAAPVVDADRARKAMLGLAETAPAHDRAFSGAYDPAFTERVYDELFRRARAVLDSGRPVVLDATFRSRELRRKARALAHEYGIRFYFIETRADTRTCQDRLRERARGPAVSDGRLEIFDDFVSRWEAVDELPSSEHFVIDTTATDATDGQTLEPLKRELPVWPTGIQ